MECAKLSLLILRPLGGFLIVIDVLRHCKFRIWFVCHYFFDSYDADIAFTNFGSLSYDEVDYDQ